MENGVKYDDKNTPNLKSKSFKYRQYLAAFIGEFCEFNL